ncbi:MAG: short-chain dehydrogenase [Candidatus Thermofonsia Clade 1 bacterium]|uniref:Short-chain dehydrogenase n=1 Tax=Candidatus Thermofonsia Clade 1 bacterium TaxID=2364210 RepID=A0A2M8PH58_9CHLR|nr:MAG: short-chain dehydrogenase [Candidatus Thermofonsia Clade 1 bacterium]RMF53373.1 MAG: SDR family oxidoreductase [Chloroflexota bacterium]
MTGKTVLITGATNGIGKEAARGLAKLGARVLIVGRNAQKCAETVAELQRSTGNQAIEALTADLSAMAEVRRLADEVKARYPRLEVLINNAGAYFSKRLTSADGYEMTFALNHLSYFYLTTLLLDLLKASAPARIVNVSSEAHQFARLNLVNPHKPPVYSGFRIYGESKLANIVFTYELARRLEGTGVTANAMHPGFVRTGFGRNNAGLASKLFGFMQRFALTPEQGADTIIYLASSPEVEGVSGKYFVKRKAKPSSRASYDQQTWEGLWTLSERLIAEKQPV